MLMSSLEKINKYFENSIQAKIESANILPQTIDKAAKAMVQCLENGGKIIVCGNGSSAALSQHFSSKLLNYFNIERPSLPVINLAADISVITAISKNNSFDEIFSRQLVALGNERDILLVISSNGNSENIIKAVKEAHDLDIKVIALTSSDGGTLGQVCNDEDIELKVPSKNIANVQENHFFIINCLCDIIDQKLFIGLED